MSKSDEISTKSPIAATSSALLPRSARAIVPVALAAFLAAPAAQANTGDQSSLADRIAAAKQILIKAGQPGAGALNVAQWLNVGIPAPWGNWNNWHNWHNWGNGMWLNL
jgi:hypothetical protein